MKTHARSHTVEFNGQSRTFGRSRRTEYENLLLGMERAVARGDLGSVGEISTRSAILNQEVLPKPHLDLFLHMLRRYNALGVVAAHSGTHLGLLFGPDFPAHPRSLTGIIRELTQHVSDIRILSAFTVPTTSRRGNWFASSAPSPNG